MEINLDPVLKDYTGRKFKMKQTYQILSLVVFLLALLLIVPLSGACAEDASGGSKSLLFNFDTDTAMPANFRVGTTGHSRFHATWRVVRCDTAPSMPNILRITEIKSPSGGQFNLCWNDHVRFRDGSISVMVRADSGRIDQGGGPMWRVKDHNNYYVARLNPLEDNFRIYFVRNGRRVMIASADVHGIRAGSWFEIRIQATGNKITGWVNGKRLVDVSDSTFGQAGGVGLWSKADAASSFDNLVINFSD